MISHWASVVSVGYGLFLIQKNIVKSPVSATPYLPDTLFFRQKISKQTLKVCILLVTLPLRHVVIS